MAKALKTIITEEINIPYIKDSDDNRLILYTKVPEWKGTDGDEGNTPEWYMKSNKYAEYTEKCEKTFNSPRNVRKLFITAECIGILFYAGIVNGDARTIKKSVRNISISDESLSNGKQALRGIVSPYVLSNLEEIYIDSRIFHSIIDNDYTISIMNQNGLYNSMNKIDMAVNSGGKFAIKEKLFNSGSVMYNILSIATGESDIQSKFKRLHTFAVINNLSKYINMLGIESDAHNKGDRASWWIMHVEHISSAYCIATASEIAMKESKINISANIYKYDRHILTAYVNKAIEYEMEQNNNNSENVGNNYEIKGELEEYLDDMCNRLGDNMAMSILQAAASTMPLEYVHKSIRSMTESGREKYSRMIKM